MRTSTETPNTREELEFKNYDQNQYTISPLNQMDNSTLQPPGQEEQKLPNQSSIKQNPMESSKIVKVSHINPNAFSKINSRETSIISNSNIRENEMKKEEAKKFKAAIALEVMIKFEGSVRDGPFMISTDLLTKKISSPERVQQEPQMELKGVHRNALGMECLDMSFEPQPLSREEKLSLKDTTIEEARRYYYTEVVQELQGNKDPLDKKELNFNKQKISKTIDLSLFENLEILHLSKNKLIQIGNLGHLPALKLLNMSGNQIKVIENLDHYRHLKELNLDGNQIRQIQGFSELEELQVLRLSFNKIHSIQNVSHLKKLKTLLLTENKIKIIDNLADLEELQTLDLSGNQISKIANLDGLFQLKWLGLAGNRIRKIENLYVMKGPGFLDISGNPFKDYQNRYFLRVLANRNITIKE